VPRLLEKGTASRRLIALSSATEFAARAGRHEFQAVQSGSGQAACGLPGQPASLQDGFRSSAARIGLDQVRRDPDFSQRQDVPVQLARGEHHDLKHVNSGLLRILSANSKPIHPRHVSINQESAEGWPHWQADSICRSASRPPSAVVGRIPHLRKKRSRIFRLTTIVVDDEATSRSAVQNSFQCREERRQLAANSAVNGNATHPSALSTQCAPCISSTMRAEMVSPSPCRHVCVSWNCPPGKRAEICAPVCPGRCPPRCRELENELRNFARPALSKQASTVICRFP